MVINVSTKYKKEVKQGEKKWWNPVKLLCRTSAKIAAKSFSEMLFPLYE